MAVAKGIIILTFGWLGVLFVLLAALGVLRMPDCFSRMQASSKAATLGSVFLVVAAGARFGDSGIWFRSAALVFFLFLTAPIAVHLIARAAFVTGARLSDETVINEAPDAALTPRSDQSPPPGREDRSDR